MGSGLKESILLPALTAALIGCASDTGVAMATRQTAETRDPSIVASIYMSEASAAMIEAGLTDLTERTIDARYPSVSALQSDGFTIQTTLFACDAAGGPCSGAELLSLIPATTQENAEIIERSIERSVFGFDSSVSTLRHQSADGDTYAVSISTYLVYDHGVSDTLFSEMLRRLLGIVAQTKGFMLSDDPAHEDLWARSGTAGQFTTDITSQI